MQKLRILLDKKSKHLIAWLALFSVFLSAVETIGIAAIMPFVDIATNFDNIHSNQYYQKAFDFLGFESDVNFVIAFGLLLFVFYIFRGGVNLLYSYLMLNFTENLYAKTTKKLFQSYLAMPYKTFVNKNTSYLTKSLITEAALVSKIVSSVLLMMSEALVIIFLYTLMLLVNWKITLVFTVILSVKVLFLTQTISKKIKSVGKIREKSEAQLYEIINKYFGNFKQVKLQEKCRIESIKNEFSTVAHEYAEVNAISGFLSAFPRLFLETIGFSLIAIFLTVLLYLEQNNVAYILPTLSLFVIALYRLLPSVNRLVSGYNTLLYYHKSIDVIDEELKIIQEDLGDKAIKFKSKIELKNASFSHQGKEVLSDISLTIKKGEKVAFIGESGSGKSTLIDLIIGLYKVNQGKMKIDNVLIDESNLQQWRSQVGYIPQQVYLFDGTIAENVCFGRELNLDLLEKVLKQAIIFDFLQKKQGVDTLVGEGGIQLSGGQKQRIAIARALYGKPEVLVLDEATSALDEETEKKIINEIYQISQDKTLIVIAHRLSTIKGCDKIFQVKNRQVNIQ